LCVGRLLVSIDSDTGGQLSLKANNFPLWRKALALDQLRHALVA
jgi:hypothetical protein